jgi:hypothetical protein
MSKDINKILWEKFINTQYHVDFFKWLSDNFDITPKKINNKDYIESLLNSEEKCKKFFVDAGIHNEDGTLNDNYKNE